MTGRYESQHDPRSSGPYSRKDPSEMNVREARALAAELRAARPDLRVEVWPIAQGLARVTVEKQLHPGLQRFTLRNRAEALPLLTAKVQHEAREETLPW